RRHVPRGWRQGSGEIMRRAASDPVPRAAGHRTLRQVTACKPRGVRGPHEARGRKMGRHRCFLRPDPLTKPGPPALEPGYTLMSKPARQMSLIAFMQAQNCSNYVGSWRHPSSMTDFLTPAYYQRIARTLEDAKFDMAFFDDRLAMPDIYGNDHR